MTNPSPICLVNSSATTNGVDVTGGSTVTIALADTAGVGQWNLTCLYTDELNSAATVNGSLSINLTTKTATFTAPSTLGSALIFQSKVNNGLDSNGVVQPSYTATFKVSVLTATSLRVAAFNETTENSASFGWVGLINNTIRNYTGSTASAGAGLVLSGGAYNVGQNADNTIKVNADDIQLNPSLYSQSGTASTLAQRDSSGRLVVGTTNSVTYGGGTVSAVNGWALTASSGSISLTSSIGSLSLTAALGITLASATTFSSTLTLNSTMSLAASNAFSLSQAQQTSDVQPKNITINTQQAYASATGGNRTAGSFIVNFPAATNSGTGHGAFSLSDNGSVFYSIFADSSANASITSTNGYSVSAGTTATLSATGNATVSSGANLTLTGTTQVQLNSSVIYLGTGSTVVASPPNNSTNSATGATTTIQGQTCTGTNSTGGDVAIIPGGGTLHNGNIGLGAAPSAGGGEKVIFIINRGAAPVSNPINGGILFVEGGALKYRGASGTVTTIANA